MKVAYLLSAYLAPIEYYSKLLNCDKIFIEQHDHYMKQTCRNRCIIAGPEKELALSISIVKPENSKCPMRDIRISDYSSWRHLYWNVMESAYNSTSLFKYYKDDFRPLYEKRYELLIDFSEELCRLVRKLIDIQPDTERTIEYKTDSTLNGIGFREATHPKKSFCQADSKFIPQPYYQIFEARHKFLSSLSIIDLLFSMRPENLLILQQTIANPR